MGGALWERDDPVQLFSGHAILECNELDNRRSVDEEPCCLLAKDVDIRWVWPVLGKIAVTSSFGDITQPSSEEQLDVAIHRGLLDIVQPQNFCDGSE